MELLYAMQSVEDIAKAPQARLNLTGGPPMRLGEAHVHLRMPGGSVELLSAMQSGELLFHWSYKSARPKIFTHKSNGELQDKVHYIMCCIAYVNLKVEL